MEEIEKTEKKISDLQQYLKGIKSALKEEENNEMIRAIRGMKLEGGRTPPISGWTERRNCPF